MGATDLNLHATMEKVRKKKDMISYWRKPAGTVNILKAI